MFKYSKSLALLLLVLNGSTCVAASVSKTAQNTAQYAVDTYQSAMVESLAKLVQHNTVAVKDLSAIDNPAHIAFKNELEKQAQALGLDFQDQGYVIIIGLGSSADRIGIITHGDIQPVNATKWQQSPFTLDLTSEPGNLIGRGTEDDKGPIVSALFAMKAIKDQQIALKKRIELYIYMAEESDWEPIKAYVSSHTLPEINITLDAEYPVVSAEKGYGTFSMTFPNKDINALTNIDEPYLSSFTGGFFGSQIPEDASAIIEHADVSLLEQFIAKARNYQGISFDLQLKNQQLVITALGKSAHSSKPEDGINAITHLADLLSIRTWPNNAAGALANFLHDNIGLGLYGEKFGKLAYQDDFMGAMSVSPTVLTQVAEGIQLNINIRRPRGKSKEQLTAELSELLSEWQKSNRVVLQDLENYIGEPWVQNNAPQIETLLSVFSHFTGIKNPKPIAIGGGTNSRLFPNAVSFGPSMPNTEYTGHSEHEFISMAQFVLNLKMYTAVMIELAQ